MSDRPRVFVARRIPELGLVRLNDACDVDLWDEALPPARAELLKRIGGCQGVLTMLTEAVDREFMEVAGDGLRVVSNFAVGYNNIDIAEASRRNIRVGNTPKVLTEATADMALALMMSAARRITEGHDYVRQGHWKTWEPLGHIGQDFPGKTLGIVGMGRIGYALAQRCQGAWGMRILYYDVQRNEPAENDLGAEKVSFETLLESADFVSVHTVLDETTRGLFDASAFQKMKPTAVFVNSARGPIHQQTDLYNALVSGEIFAAGLDVSEPEPISLDDPLLTLANCVIAPHIASATVTSRNGMAEIAANNLLAGLRGEPLPAPVN